MGLLVLRGVDWAVFFTFPALAPRSGRAIVVAGLTLVQAIVTGEAMRRGRRLDPRIAASLAPQLAWLAYATVVPLILARGPDRRAGRSGTAAG